MLAWRSILRRPRPFFSHLRPAHGHLAPILGGNNRIGTRSGGYASDTNCESHSHDQVNMQHHQAAAAATKQHLYVVLDDHKDGFGVHKLDIGEDDHMDGVARRLPGPPVLRVALPTVDEGAQFAAVGSNIVAVGREHCRSSRFLSVSGCMLIYDTKTGAISVSTQLPEGLRAGYQTAMAVGNRLYMLEGLSEPCLGGGSDDDGAYDGDLHCLVMDQGGEESRDRKWYWSNRNRLLSLPFRQSYPDNVVAWAVHAPPGAAHHDIYVSACPAATHPRSTFSFSTASGTWTRHGEWLLPVIGHALYDHGELDAWLGLHAIDDHTAEFSIYGRRPLCMDGYLCIGHVASPPPEWKVGREKLFRLEEDAAAGWRHIDAKLVPMAACNGGSDYCIMERLRPDGDDEKEGLGDGDKCLLRLTRFRVERGEDGVPVATARSPVRTYRVSRYEEYFDAQAFWM